MHKQVQKYPVSFWNPIQNNHPTPTHPKIEGAGVRAMIESEDEYGTQVEPLSFEEMATGHMRETGTWTEWEDWFTERGLGILGRPEVIRGMYDRLHEHMYLFEIEQIWAYVGQQKMRDPKGFFMKTMKDACAEDLQEILRKTKRHEELQKLRGHNMDPGSHERQIMLRDIFICDHMLERRTIEWMMVKEKLTRSQVLEIWDRLRPGMDCPGIRREGPEAWEDVTEATDNWRRETEAGVLRQRRKKVFEQAQKNKAARRMSKGLPPPDKADPFELTPEDFGV